MLSVVTMNTARFQPLSVKYLILPVLLITLVILVFFSGVLVTSLLNDKTPTEKRNDVAKTPLSSTLSLSAMSLAVSCARY